jgi:hypothetical protein
MGKRAIVKERVEAQAAVLVQCSFDPLPNTVEPG